MAGAYVAKPADVIESSLPPGWGDWPFRYWPFPGPSPPGYSITPELRFSTPSTYPIYSTRSTTATIVDVKSETDFATREPKSESQVIYSATMDGIPLILLGGDGQLGAEIFYSYDSEEIDGFWGHLAALAFPSVTEEDDEKLITVVANTIEPFGEEPWAGFATYATSIMEVVATSTYWATFECVISGDQDPCPNFPYYAPRNPSQTNWGMGLWFYTSAGGLVVPTAYTNIHWQRGKEIIPGSPPDGIWYVSDTIIARVELEDFGIAIPESLVAFEAWEERIYEYTPEPTTEAKEIIKAFYLREGEIYYIKWQDVGRFNGPAGALYDLTFKLYREDGGDGELLETITKQIIKVDTEFPEASQVHWLTVDADTGEVTIVNP